MGMEVEGGVHRLVLAHHIEIAKKIKIVTSCTWRSTSTNPMEARLVNFKQCIK